MQIGTPEDIYDRPATTFVAQLVGTPQINLLEARREDGALGGTRDADPHPARRPGSPEAPASLDCRHPSRGPAPRPMDGQFAARSCWSSRWAPKRSSTSGRATKTLISTRSRASSIFKVGDRLSFDISPEHLHYFDTSGKRLG